MSKRQKLIIGILVGIPLLAIGFVLLSLVGLLLGLEVTTTHYLLSSVTLLLAVMQTCQRSYHCACLDPASYPDPEQCCPLALS